MPNHIENLKIDAFRQLRQLEFQECCRVNLLVGVNNSGKTSVLEAIAAHCRPLDPMGWIAIARQREVKSSREPILDALRWLFPQQEADSTDPYYEGRVRIESSGLYPNLETIAHFQGLAAPAEDVGSAGSDSVNDDDEDEVSGASFGVPLQDSHERGADISLTARFSNAGYLAFDGEGSRVANERFRIWESQRYVSQTATVQPALPVATISPFSHRVRQLQVSKLTHATLAGRMADVVDMIRLVDAEIEGLEILSRAGIRPTLYVRHKRTGFTPLSALGDGVRRVLEIALSLSSVPAGVLLIDEIETAIHRDALTDVFKWLVEVGRRLNVQIFATTHSLEAIDSLLTAQLDDPSQIVAYHLPDGGAGQIKRFEGEILDSLRFERGLDIR